MNNKKNIHQREIEVDPMVVQLRTFIIMSNKTPDQIAESAGVSKSTVERFVMLEVKQPRHLTVVKIAKALNLKYKLTK